MKTEKKNQFIEALESLYGKYVYDSALFGSSNYSKIASDLCYSNSHFTKLMSGGATDGMYDRAMKNVEKLQKLRALEDEATSIKNASYSSNQWRAMAIISLLLFLGISAYFLSTNSYQEVQDDAKHPLNMYFDFNDAYYYKSPYLTEEQVHEYCPCSGYEGRWELQEEYIIPIPYKIPGLYYVGRSADIRLKCRKTTLSNKGYELIGFENIKNEIWFDKSMTKLNLASIGEDANSLEEEMKKIDFDEKSDFVKIANVFSCFYDEVLITKDSIFRTGEPCGRYANSENDELLKKFDLDLNHIIEYVIGNMVFAQCAAIENPYKNPNNLSSGESVISFPCKCFVKTDNLGLGGAYPYTKSIKLEEQNYQSNLICD